MFKFCILLNFVSFFGSFLVPESIKWLVSVGKQQQARESLGYIARINQVKPLKIGNLLDESEAT